MSEDNSLWRLFLSGKDQNYPSKKMNWEICVENFKIADYYAQVKEEHKEQKKKSAEDFKKYRQEIEKMKIKQREKRSDNERKIIKYGVMSDRPIFCLIC